LNLGSGRLLVTAAFVAHEVLAHGGYTLRVVDALLTHSLNTDVTSGAFNRTVIVVLTNIDVGFARSKREQE